MLQITYLILCILGTVLPFSQFLPFLIENGFDVKLFFEQLFVNRISAAFGLDFTISSLALFIFVFSEGSRLKMKNLWVYIASYVLAGISLALPLFLLMRQRHIEEFGITNDK